LLPDRSRRKHIEQIVVTSEQMRQIEARIFAAGMPVAALMEKVGGSIAQRVQELYPYPQVRRVGVLVGPGHNGGDALVVARELHFQGYEVLIYRPIAKLKELTNQHAQYAESLGIPHFEAIAPLQDCDLLIDGLFGFGMERQITDPIAAAIHQIERWSMPIVSIDLPSGLHTDSGEALGTAIKATQTFCLGLWKQGLLQDQALEYVGTAELIDFDLPLADVQAILADTPKVKRITSDCAIATLPLTRPPVTHKYKQGHLLIICGSRRYAGGALLTALGARASGVGMLSIAVPESIKPLLNAQLPEALVVGCPETENGAIAHLNLPEGTDLDSFQAIACGPGLTLEATPIVQAVLSSDRPLVLDADGLNILAILGIQKLLQRLAPTVLTPHAGEFKRLFPDAPNPMQDRISAARTAAQTCKAIVLLKGARTAIATPSGQVWLNPESTPALARGGSGDVLTGLLGGLLAQATAQHISVDAIVATAAWWHSQAGILADRERTQMGVDAFTLTQYLIPVLVKNHTL
jgi:ADP-dependent NAD(P)H-hydrate dehydratase / NAD(P)H-hydrate epimerase